MRFTFSSSVILLLFCAMFASGQWRDGYCSIPEQEQPRPAQVTYQTAEPQRLFRSSNATATRCKGQRKLLSDRPKVFKCRR